MGSSSSSSSPLVFCLDAADVRALDCGVERKEEDDDDEDKGGSVIPTSGASCMRSRGNSTPLLGSHLKYRFP